MFLLGVEHWKDQIGSNLATSIKLRIPRIHNIAVTPWGLSSTGEMGKSPDLKLRSLNLCSVHVRRSGFLNNEDVGLEAAII